MENKELIESLNSIPEDFCFLYLGSFIERKNIGLMIKSFYETFKKTNGKKPAFVLKTSILGSSYSDIEEIIKYINKIKSTIKTDTFPNIYLLHGDFKDEEINQIYNHPKIKALFHLTHGEGFGRTLLEFSLTGKPIITSNWSGHLDFLDKKHNILLDGVLIDLPKHELNKWFIEGSKWFEPNYDEIGYALKDVFLNYKKNLKKSTPQAEKNKNQFNVEGMKLKLNDILNKHIPHIPTNIPFQTPKLLNLPKLKKIN